MPTPRTLARISTGEKLARLLAAKFMEEGNFAPGVAMEAGALLPASLQGIEDSPRFESAFSDAGFAGLAVQAVGHTVGGSVDEEVIIYVARGRLKSTVMAVDSVQIPVRVTKIGRLAVKPEQASGNTHRGNLYLHKSQPFSPLNWLCFVGRNGPLLDAMAMEWSRYWPIMANIDGQCPRICLRVQRAEWLR